MSSSEETRSPQACVSFPKMVALFYPAPSVLGSFQIVDEVDVAEPYRSLLAHENHMTVTVESHHKDSVDVEVLKSTWEKDRYLREILLKTHHTGAVVQYGIVRLDTRFVPEAPREEILSQKKPLGRVLIEHDVLRKIELFELVRVECGPELAKNFGVAEGSVTYGRTAILHCNNEPAIELLEIVRPE